jgi:hypothetical protein
MITMTTAEITREDVMKRAELDDDEFDDLYDRTLRIIHDYGTIGAETMLRFVEQELSADRESIK